MTLPKKWLGFAALALVVATVSKKANWQRRIGNGLRDKRLLVLTIPLLYLIWIFGFDRDAVRKSNRKTKTIQQWLHKPIHYFKQRYFPAILLRDFQSPLEDDETYLAVFHPHGIIGVSVALHFIFSDGFPEIDYRVVTLSSNFYWPIIREILLSLGLADASRQTMKSLLNRGISVGVVVGGAQEALDARPGTNDLVLAHRIGFAQLALEEGANLIPIFTFGENDLYRPIIPNPPGSTFRKFQEKFKKIFKFVPVLVGGLFGILPFPDHKPIHTIVGEPIHVNKVEKPTLQQILELHGIYVERLKDLYEKYKHLYPNRKEELNIVDKVTDGDLRKWEKWFGENNKNTETFTSKL